MRKDYVGIIDYGMSNILSVRNAVEYLGYKTKVLQEAVEISKSQILILPGVGSFKEAMLNLKNSGIDKSILEAVLEKNVKILGICLGMQILSKSSTENGYSKGLELIPFETKGFHEISGFSKKIPHIGFDQIVTNSDSILFSKIKNYSDFYFLHSYYLSQTEQHELTSICEYGVKIVAAYEKNNICAVQFHPEKSQQNGLKLLENFLKF